MGHGWIRVSGRPGPARARSGVNSALTGHDGAIGAPPYGRPGAKYRYEAANSKVQGCPRIRQPRIRVSGRRGPARARSGVNGALTGPSELPHTPTGVPAPNTDPNRLNARSGLVRPMWRTRLVHIHRSLPSHGSYCECRFWHAQSQHSTPDAPSAPVNPVYPTPHTVLLVALKGLDCGSRIADIHSAVYECDLGVWEPYAWSRVLRR